MRPVNLIPADARKRTSSVARAVAPSHLVVGALALVVLAVGALALTGKQIGDREAEVAQLERTESEIQARARSLAAFAGFQRVREDRELTIAALAASRFDWQRVMRELALVIPKRVWLVNLTGTVTPEVSVQDGAGVGMREQAPGPALELVGCARSQRDVARLVAALRDIDGVTRVTAVKSEKPGSEVIGGGGERGDGQDCRTRSFVAKFEVIAAFDEVAVPDGALPIPPPESGVGDDGGVAEAAAQREDQGADLSDSKSRVDQATKLVPGG